MPILAAFLTYDGRLPAFLPVLSNHVPGVSPSSPSGREASGGEVAHLTVANPVVDLQGLAARRSEGGV